MATLLPDLSEAQLTALPSQAETKVYRALRDRLPDRYVVLFQVSWILRREDEQAKDGEADFLVKQEVRRLEIELRREAALLAIELAKKLLEAKINDADQRRLIDDFVRQMENRPAPPRPRPPTGAPPTAVDQGWTVEG